MRHRPRLAAALLLLACLLPLVGCSALRTVGSTTRKLGNVAFTGATMSDLTLEGVRTNACVDGFFTPKDESQAILLDDLLHGQTVGCLLGVSRVGQSKPEWIFCAAGDMADTCKSIPANAKVRFSGQPLSQGRVWVPNRLTWSE